MKSGKFASSSFSHRQLRIAHLFNDDKIFSWAIQEALMYSVCACLASVSTPVRDACARMICVKLSTVFSRDVLYCAIISFQLINLKMPF